MKWCIGCIVGSANGRRAAWKYGVVLYVMDVREDGWTAVQYSTIGLSVFSCGGGVEGQALEMARFV